MNVTFFNEYGMHYSIPGKCCVNCKFFCYLYFPLALTINIRNMIQGHDQEEAYDRAEHEMVEESSNISDISEEFSGQQR